ncbi:conjugative transposon protein TraK [Pedobacter paludis]|uniref:Conjugative transposon protein TraK n=2 Tax=Pedobacter paludis TaxID=2203212 RepID=A0A317F097_9SPHI|nr:conjugative transposon protein TraK [Pedobacter paludis]
MKNIDGAFRSIRLFTLAVIVGSLLFSGLALVKSFSAVTQSQQRVYILANGKVLEAYASDRRDNISVEAKDHVKTFHQLFFTLSPDEKAIDENIKRSLYLADISAKRAYDNLRESSYYSNIISGNVNQTIHVDSIYLDTNKSPIYFRCYATQRLTRPTSLAVRSLVTEGYLRNVMRSENNAHGFLIERWNTIDNRDISVSKR